MMSPASAKLNPPPPAVPLTATMSGAFMVLKRITAWCRVVAIRVRNASPSLGWA